jgi:hypothetical protein
VDLLGCEMGGVGLWGKMVGNGLGMCNLSEK